MDQTTDTTKIVQLLESKSFLGQEFLTWLWYSIEENAGTFTLDAPPKGIPSEIELWIDDKIVLEATGTEAHMHSLKGGNPSASLEATASLVAGKNVTEMKLGINVGDEKIYKLTLNHKDLSPKSVVLPKLTAQKGDLAETVSLQIESLNGLVSILDELYKNFIRARTLDSWDNEDLDGIREWIGHRSKDELTFH